MRLRVLEAVEAAAETRKLGSGAKLDSRSPAGKFTVSTFTHRPFSSTLPC